MGVSLKMSASSRGEVLEQARRRYEGRGKEGRSRLLDEVCALCGYERKYASKLLGGKRAIAGRSGRRRGGSQAVYGSAEREVIKAIWLAAEQPCGKRLKAASIPSRSRKRSSRSCAGFCATRPAAAHASPATSRYNRVAAYLRRDAQLWCSAVSLD